MTRAFPAGGWRQLLRLWLVGAIALRILTMMVAAPDLSRVADPTERIRYLRSEIARHDELYYRKAQPEISDTDYDALKADLTALTEQFPEEAAKLGPTPVSTFGDDRTPGFTAARHQAPMLSLDKVYRESDLKEFCRKTAKAVSSTVGNAVFIIEPKFDGLGVSAVYEKGQLARVITRGDGHEGDDVTANARQIAALPATLRVADGHPVPDVVEVRGEVYLPFAEFDRLNRARDEAGEIAYSSPRNLAVATLKSPDSATLGWRKLEVVFYGLGAYEPMSAAPASQRLLLEQLARWGLPTVQNPVVADSAEAVWRAVEEFGRLRAELPYPVDGAVVKLDSAAGQRLLGASDRAPRWAVAYKYSPERATTRLKAITIQVGRTGVLTPVAELEPVRLGGATIRRATLHNAAEIARRDIRVGDQVYVERTGEVIPAVVGVDVAARGPSSAAYQFPTICPVCGATAVRREGEVSWRCPNLRCEAQLGRRLEHYASVDGVGIRGLRAGMIDKLIDGKLVHDLPDLYRLRREDLLTLSRSGEKSADTLLAAIAASRHVELWRFVSGLGIRGVGESGAKALADHFGTLDAMLVADEQDFTRIDGLGAEAEAAAGEFFRGEAGRRLLEDFKTLGVWPRSREASAGVLAGKSVVITGALSAISRSRVIELIEAAGGKVTEAVSRHTSFVVGGAEPGAKLLRARELGIEVIDEAELLRRLTAEEAIEK